MPHWSSAAASSWALLGLGLLLAFPATEAATLRRDLPDGPYLCNESYLVTLFVDVENGTRTWGIDEVLPEGWKAVLPSQGGSAATPGHAKWLKFSNQGLNDTAVRYFMYIPKGTIGAFSLSAEFIAGDQPGNVTGDSSLAVACPAGQESEEKSGGGGQSWLPWAFGGLLVLALAILLVVRSAFRP